MLNEDAYYNKILEDLEERWVYNYYATKLFKQLKQRLKIKGARMEMKWSDEDNNDWFYPVLLGFEYGDNISGTGWPDSIVLDNGLDLNNAMYHQKNYVPEKTCERVPGKMKYGRRMPACSKCGYSLGDKRWNFCPKCGSKICD